jgi:glycerophosphoryl diester phosphodiesterase
VLFHDDELHRTTDYIETLALASCLWEMLQQLDAGSWFHKDHQGERIPLFEQLLKLPRGSAGLMIELKSGQNNALLAECVVKELRAHDLLDDPKVVVGSLDIDLIQHLLTLLPKQKIIGIIEDVPTLQQCLEWKIPLLAVCEQLITPSLINECHQQNSTLWSWTVDDVNRAQELVQMGVTGLITNDLQRLKHL